MSEELKLCPFCGGETLMRERYASGVANRKHYRRERHHCRATFELKETAHTQPKGESDGKK